MKADINTQEMNVEELLTIVESISDGVMAVNNDLQVIYFNNSAEIITGKKREAVIGMNCNTVMSVCDGDCAMIETIQSKKRMVNQYLCINRSDGKEVPISVSTALLKDKTGKIVGGVETFRDLSLVETLRKELEYSYSFSDIIGHSQLMQNLFELIPIIAQSDSTVLIEGESGTGKELVARAIHNSSHRQQNPMIVVNSGAIPDTLLESELFGYKAGAFTDAKKDKLGRFALAKGGTLFLDEIGDISSALQVKLLRVLQDQVYEPLGSVKSEKANVRIIAATNKNLVKLMETGQFRQDLYYRLNVVGLSLPPLRERETDIPLLIDHFIGKFNLIFNKDILGVTHFALNILMKHHYPGNVRELENIIEHAFVVCPSGVIRPEYLPHFLQNSSRSIPLFEVNGSLEQVEILTITAALKRNNGQRKETALELGINPSTLYRKMQKYKLPCKTEKS
ncbi:MAG: sigma 54-interacting transcriptional regulator [Candidatus Hatepunaea meridiana]|nr:sigma 54-interacting transcriptional regulator [Candidatus Hatepunaea meridiana]